MWFLVSVQFQDLQEHKTQTRIANRFFRIARQTSIATVLPFRQYKEYLEVEPNLNEKRIRDVLKTTPTPPCTDAPFSSKPYIPGI